MSGEVARTAGTGSSELQYGPRSTSNDQSPFSAQQLARLDEALTLSSRETGLVFSVFIGELKNPTRAHAEALFEKLTDDAVLVAISPAQRVLHIVTGPDSAKRLPNRACALAALGMRASFANGDLVGGITSGLRMLSDSAGSD